MKAASQIVDPEDTTNYVAPGAYIAVALLSLTQFCSFFDKIILSFVFVPLQKDLGLSDTQLGLLAGPAFALGHLAACLPLGFLVDRVSRRRILIFALSFWSLMTLGCGIAPSFLLLLVCRALIGAGESVQIPCASSMIGDLFGARPRPVAFGVLFNSGASGILITYLFGGTVLYWLSQFPVISLPTLGVLQPWRATLLISSLFGFALVPFLLAYLREPRRGAASAESVGSDRQGLARFVKSHMHVTFALIFGVSTLNLGIYTFLSWMSVFYNRVYGWTPSKAGIIFALACGSAALAGSVATGMLPGILRRRGWSAPTLLACLLSGVAVNMAGAAAMLMPNPLIATGLLAIAFLGMTSASVLALSMINEVVPAHLRGGFTAVFMVGIVLLSASLGPFMVGFLTDHVFRAAAGIGPALSLVWLTSLILGGGILATAFDKYAGLTGSLVSVPLRTALARISSEG